MEILSILKSVYSDPMFLFSFYLKSVYSDPMFLFSFYLKSVYPMFLFSFYYQFFIGLSIFLNVYFISLNVYFIFLNVSRHDLCCSVDIDAFLSLSLYLSKKIYVRNRKEM